MTVTEATSSEYAWEDVARFLWRHAGWLPTLGPTVVATPLLWIYAALGGHPVWWLFGAVLAPGAVWPLASLVFGLGMADTRYLRRGLGLLLAAWALFGFAGLVAGWWAQRAGRAVEAWESLSQPALPVLIATFLAGVWAAGLLPSRREEALFLPGVLLTWTLWRPMFFAGALFAAGHSQAAGTAWLSAVTHLVWAMSAWAGMLLLRGWTPVRYRGYGALLLLVVLSMVTFAAYLAAATPSAPARAGLPPALPTLTPQPTSSATIASPAEPTSTPTASPTPSPRPTPTPIPPTRTPTPSPSLTPTPPARVDAVVVPPPRYRGIYLREGPGFQYQRLRGLMEGTRVEILTEEEPVEADGYWWVWVLAYPPEDEPIYGWVLAHLVATVTPTSTLSP